MAITSLEKASELLSPMQLRVNPGDGLKTRGWDETGKALKALLEAARIMRTRMAAVA
jgi:5-methyltetrahydropteroyltriglutamate--homocysteine methyltransferase